MALRNNKPNSRLIEVRELSHQFQKTSKLQNTKADDYFKNDKDSNESIIQNSDFVYASWYTFQNTTANYLHCKYTCFPVLN